MKETLLKDLEDIVQSISKSKEHHVKDAGRLRKVCGNPENCPCTASQMEKLIGIVQKLVDRLES